MESLRPSKTALLFFLWAEEEEEEGVLREMVLNLPAGLTFSL